MTNLFKKAAVFTDLHLGLKSNSVVHNEDCWSFIQWMVKKAKEEGCETCFFLGDYHNHRASINILTLNYSLMCLEHLNDNFENVYFIPGNHDLYYRDRRDVHSTEFAKHLSNVHIINNWFQSGDVVIAPWLVGDDHHKIQKLSAKYLFGHLELPHFKMNAMVEMPDHGILKHDDFNGIESVYSGHFHLRQKKRNIHYIGNCFPHNFADAGDDARGIMILPWGQDPEFYTWDDQPKYRVYNLSDIINNSHALLDKNMHVRVNLDIEISYEEANYIKETFITQYNLREMALIPYKKTDLTDITASGDVKFESVDQIVVDQITRIESEFYDPKLLLQIYQTL